MTDRTEKLISQVQNPEIRKLLSVGNEQGKELHAIYIDSSIEKLAKYISDLESKINS